MGTPQNIELDFGRSDWVCSRPNPLEYDSCIVTIPIEGELERLCFYESIEDNPSAITTTLNRPSVTIGSRKNDSEILLVWIEERREWVVIIHTSWIEGAGFTDDGYSHPHALNPECTEKLLRAYGVDISSFSPADLSKIAPNAV